MSSAQQDHSARLWYALDVEIEASAREAVEYALMEAGALGTETNEDATVFRVTAYFDQLPQREQVRASLSEALRIYDLPSATVQDMAVREVPDEDWLGEWKKGWQPVEVGRFIIAPPWSEVPSVDQIVIRIEPGMAFGTGTHESTRLCLAAIEKHFRGGSFLDVGTGTGILAIAAAKLFPEARVDACDTDAEAIAIAKENARLNDVHRVLFRTATIDASTASADFVCANLTADVIVSMLPALIGATCGRLVLSGILDSQVDEVIERIRQTGLAGPVEIVNDGEWRALIL
ncbi:MAG TPA: 50S ribosomal protein L11 methyltransferase [Pyrinomonadaceae bacterium]|nr:50S ribosomal protein L11 methyltransferase [Pyrinomonadaceae bacterium]